MKNINKIKYRKLNKGKRLMFFIRKIERKIERKIDMDKDFNMLQGALIGIIMELCFIGALFI